MKTVLLTISNIGMEIPTHDDDISNKLFSFSKKDDELYIVLQNKLKNE